MAPSVSQILAVSYPAVLNEMNKPANQWAESAFMRELERQGLIKRVSMGPTIEHTLDYQRNPGADFLVQDLDNVSLAQTEVVTAAVYTPATLSVPITWSKADEAKNPTQNQKVALTKSLLENGFTSHDDLIEEKIFGTIYRNFNGLQTLFPSTGQGSPGGIDAATDAWWRHYAGTWKSDGSDIRSKLTIGFNTAAKGTGGAQPTLIVSDGDTQAVYEGVLQTYERFVDTKEGDIGFKVLAFKTARYVFSQHAGTNIYGLSKKSFRLNVSKEAYRQKGDTIEIPNQEGYVVKMFSMLQASTPNKSRAFMLAYTAA